VTVHGGEDGRLNEADGLTRRGVRHMRSYQEINRRFLQTMIDSGRVDLRRTGRFDFRPPPAAARELFAARECYLAALRVIPKGATANLAIIHHQLGGIFKELGIAFNAEHHLGEAIRLREAIGDRFGAGTSRHDLAQTLIHRGRRYRAARTLAEKALADFATCGPGAGAEAENIRELISEIDDYLAARR
jgi:hypothetical protein